MIAELIAKNSVIKYKVITEAAFQSISSLFSDLKSELETEYPRNLIECLYEITIGNHVYSGPSYEEFEKQYKKGFRADNLRFVIQVSDPEQQLNPVLSRVILVLDKKLESTLSVAGNGVSWVNGVFTRFDELFKNIPKRNVILHSVLFEMCVQLFAVIAITVFAIYSAQRLSTSLPVNYSEVYVFAIVFLLLSNLWTYGSRALTAVRDIYYPIVDIIKAPRMPIFLSALTFLGLTSITWAIHYLLNLIFTNNP